MAFRSEPRQAAPSHGTRLPPAAARLVDRAVQEQGEPLPAHARHWFEPHFAHDLSRVRVHADAAAAASAGAIGARAYTAGYHVVFGAGQAADSAGGRRRLAHELAHVVQQGGDAPGAGAAALPLGRPGDRAEAEADAAAATAMAGSPVRAGALSRAAPAIRRDGPPAPAPAPAAEAKPEEKKEATDVLVDGAKIAAEQLKDNNPLFKSKVLDPLEKWGLRKVDQLDTGAKIGLGAVGVGTLGMGMGTMLADPAGRKRLEGVNLVAPLALIPYMPLTGLRYTLPDPAAGADPVKRMTRIDLTFKADKLLNLRTEKRGLPAMAFSVDLQLGYDAQGNDLRVLQANGTFSPVPGLAFSGGLYGGALPALPPTYFGTDGQAVQSRAHLPEGPKPAAVPDMRFMISVDLMKFKPAELVRQLRAIF